ncbi:outer membrane protein assembly factor BamB family protein [Halococcus saccharolyticus]|uniref:outer membrane protein assembly factor BamB family protein n=1 Tax=Halococcus saccharolyticus TaxID=62319 RepID=UPI0019D3FCC1|nr:PQQ-binding-like beta-propeller repeat protein [Halococcus saccharolyticus]
MPLDDWQVLGLDTADNRLFATLSENNGPSAVAAIDPAEQSIIWQMKSEGEPVGGSHASYQRIARGQWGVTLANETVYAVTGRVGERRWGAVQALDQATGERRWSLRRNREFALAGVTADLVVATGLEFSERRTVSHTTTGSPLSTVVYGLDSANGKVRWTREFIGVQDVAVNSNGVYVAVADRLVGLELDGKRRFAYEYGPATRVEAATERVFYLTGKDAASTLHGVGPNGSVDWQHDLPIHELLLDGNRLYAGGKAVVTVETDGTIVWRDDTYGEWLLLDPDGDTLYTRSRIRSDAATAYDVAGKKRWTFDPPSNNAWPEAATNDALIVSAITGDTANQPFLTVYAINSQGQPTASLGKETVFDATGLSDTAYLADGNSATGDSNLLALDP